MSMLNLSRRPTYKRTYSVFSHHFIAYVETQPNKKWRNRKRPVRVLTHAIIPNSCNPTNDAIRECWMQMDLMRQFVHHVLNQNLIFYFMYTDDDETSRNHPHTCIF